MQPKSLSYLLDEDLIIDMRGDDNHVHSSLCDDSRTVGVGSAFVATRGTAVDGHKYIEHAIDRGATGIVCEEFPEKLHEHITYVLVKNSRHALGIAAARFYDDPSHDMKIVGVTGTNGKTTIATLLYQILSMSGHKTGLISTVETRIGNKEITRGGAATTPGPIILQKTLYDMRAAGCTHVCMEVSSHAMDQQRVAGIEFTGGIFSNITHDHLDYHGTFENYITAKQSFFDMLPATAFAIANIDDENGAFILQNTKAATYFYGLHAKSDFDLDIHDTDISGSNISINDQNIHIPLPGAYNAYNAAAVFGAAELLDIPIDRIAKLLSKIVPPPGRFEVLPHRRGIFGVLDYAHTPDALENLLQTVRDLAGERKIITVVGAGGGRDVSKRSSMGRIVAEKSDISIFTSDNPRNEEPLAIINDLRSGLYLVPEAQVLVTPDRDEAIRQAVELAKPGDIVVLAGKGHEQYQEAKGQKIPFSDKEIFLRAK